MADFRGSSSRRIGLPPDLAVQERRHLRVVAGAGGDASRGDTFDTLPILTRQHHVCRGGVLLEPGLAASCRGSARCRGPASRSHASASCAGVQPFSRARASIRSASATLRLEVLALEARLAAPPVVRRQILRRAGSGRRGSRGRAGCRRRARSPARAAPAARVLGLAGAERVFGLHRRDRMDGVRAPHRAGAASDRPRSRTLPALHQIGHRADRLLDRHVRVDAVQVVEVDRARCRGAPARRRRPRGRAPGRPSTGYGPPRRWTKPNLVATTTSARRPAMARPTSAFGRP